LTRTPYARIVTATVLAVALAGCVRIDAHLSIAGDTVSGTVILALDRAAAEQLNMDPNEAFAEEHAELTSLDRVTATPYDDGTWTGQEYTFDRVLLGDLNRLSQTDPDGLRITRDIPAGTYSLTMVMDLTWAAEAGQPQADLLDRLDARIAVTFPGEVVEHNGSLAGSTVTWRPPAGERTELVAVAYAPDEPAAGTGDSGDGNLLAVVLLGGVAALVLAAAGLGASWLVRRRRPHAVPSDTLWDFRPPPADDEPTTQRLS
jgi:hypothetical protein